MKSFNLAALMTLPIVMGFQSTSPSSSILTSRTVGKVSCRSSLSMASTEMQDDDYSASPEYSTSPLPIESKEVEDDDYYPNRLPTQKGKKMSESIPFLGCSKVLQESDLAGNVGFDPLGLSKNKEQLWEYREAEIKHSRLAMLGKIRCPSSDYKQVESLAHIAVSYFMYTSCRWMAHV